MDRNTRLSRDERRALAEEVSNEIRAAQNATEILDEITCERLDIGRTDCRCLDIIERHGRIPAGELAKAAGLSSSATTTLLDRLETAGYVCRVRDSEDRRRVYVELTDDARREASAIYGPLAELARKQLLSMSARDLTIVRDFLREGRGFILQHVERLRRGMR